MVKLLVSSLSLSRFSFRDWGREKGGKGRGNGEANIISLKSSLSLSLPFPPRSFHGVQTD